jgi:hypothetical protein
MVPVLADVAGELATAAWKHLGDAADPREQSPTVRRHRVSTSERRR